MITTESMALEILLEIQVPWMISVFPNQGSTGFQTFLFSRERERDSASRGGTEREGDTESEAGSRFRAISTGPDMGLELTSCEIMT